MSPIQDGQQGAAVGLGEGLRYPDAVLGQVGLVGWDGGVEGVGCQGHEACRAGGEP